eukprot:TCALIF_00261-PA protein Name:"Protein of unknown function" AED:0.22 eAED:0.22 QI:150/1/0.5/1/0/0/2/0/93
MGINRFTTILRGQFHFPYLLGFTSVRAITTHHLEGPKHTTTNSRFRFPCFISLKGETLDDRAQSYIFSTVYTFLTPSHFWLGNLGAHLFRSKL